MYLITAVTTQGNQRKSACLKEIRERVSKTSGQVLVYFKGNETRYSS